MFSDGSTLGSLQQSELGKTCLGKQGRKNTGTESAQRTFREVVECFGVLFSPPAPPKMGRRCNLGCRGVLGCQTDWSRDSLRQKWDIKLRKQIRAIC